MIANYKDKRDSLDDLLYEMEVPREYFFRLAELNSFIAIHREDHPKAQEALDLIQEISPVKLTHFKLEGESNV